MLSKTLTWDSHAKTTPLCNKQRKLSRLLLGRSARIAMEVIYFGIFFCIAGKRTGNVYIFIFTGSAISFPGRMQGHARVENRPSSYLLVYTSAREQGEGRVGFCLVCYGGV